MCVCLCVYVSCTNNPPSPSPSPSPSPLPFPLPSPSPPLPLPSPSPSPSPPPLPPPLPPLPSPSPSPSPPPLPPLPSPPSYYYTLVRDPRGELVESSSQLLSLLFDYALPAASAHGTPPAHVMGRGQHAPGIQEPGMGNLFCSFVSRLHQNGVCETAVTVQIERES